MMSCSRPRFGGYSALQDFFVRRFVLSFVVFAHFKIYIGQAHCRLYSTSYSDRPTVPQHHEAASGHPARWIGYDGDRSSFIRRPRRSSSQSCFINNFATIYYFSSCSPFLHNFYYTFYDVHMISSFSC